MEVYDDKRKKVGVLAGFKDRTITTTLDSGDKELSFEYPAKGKLAGYLKEECYIRTKTDEFVLKEVERGEKFNKYTAVLNVEELEGTIFAYGFESQEQTVRACLSFAFEGTGWSVGTCTVTKRRTIREEESVSAWDVLQRCLGTYRCECTINSLQKTVSIYERIGNDKGCYFMEGLNLRKLTLKSDTYEFYTRIYPIGKDGITPGWVLGHDYIDNFQYSTKVKSRVWKDELYTNTTSLIEDATVKLEEASRPYKAYTADVADLAKMNPKYKDVLAYGIGDTVTLVSKSRKIRERQRIVKLVEYPERPEKNTAEISNARKTFDQIQQEETETARQEAINVSNKRTKKLLENYSTTEEVETWITASETQIGLGVKETLKGYYNKTETDALVNVAKGEIDLAVSQTYQTKDAMGAYSTTEQMTAAINIATDGIQYKVSKNELISLINQTAEMIHLKAKYLKIEGDNFRLDENGVYVCGEGRFTKGFYVSVPGGNDAFPDDKWNISFEYGEAFFGGANREELGEYQKMYPYLRMKNKGVELNAAADLSLEAQGSVYIQGRNGKTSVMGDVSFTDRPVIPAHDGATATTGTCVSMKGTEHVLTHDWILFADAWFFVTVIDTTAFWSTYYNK